MLGRILRSSLVFASVFVTVHFGNTTARAQNLIVNGDFETGPFVMPGTVANWTVSGNGRVAELQEGATTASHCAAFNEGSDSQNNILSQSFPTTAGQLYILEFDSGIFGQPSNTLQLHFQVVGNSAQISENQIVPVANTFIAANVEFHHYFRMFTADSSTTTLTFNDVGLGNGSADLVVDTVSVIVAPSPTPSPTPAPLPLFNGDFEQWPFNDPGTVAGWIVAGNARIESITQGASSPIHSAGFSVGSDSFNNILSQSFITTVNQTYNFDFDAGVFGIRSGTPLQLHAQILGPAALVNQTVTPPDNSATHPGQVIFQHYHFTFTATNTVTTVQFNDVTGGNLGADVMLDSVSILPQPPSFSQWKALYFTAGQQADPSISGWTADPDKDGVPNGLEYFFHTNPTSDPASDAAQFPQVGLSSSGGSTYLTFTYRRLLGWTGNQAVVAVSDDLTTWDNSQTQIEQVGAPARSGDGATEIVTVRLKTPITTGPIPKKFFRLTLAP
jgi:hypothetical protein